MKKWQRWRIPEGFLRGYNVIDINGKDRNIEEFPFKLLINHNNFLDSKGKFQKNLEEFTSIAATGSLRNFF